MEMDVSSSILGFQNPQINIREALTVNQDLSFGTAMQRNTYIDQSIMHFGLGMQYATKSRKTFFELAVNNIILNHTLENTWFNLHL